VREGGGSNKTQLWGNQGHRVVFRLTGVQITPGGGGRKATRVLERILPLGECGGGRTSISSRKGGVERAYGSVKERLTSNHARSRKNQHHGKNETPRLSKGERKEEFVGEKEERVWSRKRNLRIRMRNGGGVTFWGEGLEHETKREKAF